MPKSHKVFLHHILDETKVLQAHQLLTNPIALGNSFYLDFGPRENFDMAYLPDSIGIHSGTSSGRGGTVDLAVKAYPMKKMLLK